MDSDGEAVEPLLWPANCGVGNASASPSARASIWKIWTPSCAAARDTGEVEAKGIPCLTSRWICSSVAARAQHDARGTVKRHAGKRTDRGKASLEETRSCGSWY
eukprot:2601197-Rhodomonas_salina.1